MAEVAAARGRPLLLSAVVACYKDALAIPLLHERLVRVFASLAVDYEIIFVNDGSPDDTESVLEALTKNDGHVLAIEHSRNFGSQNAFISGMQLAKGDAVVLLDGDLQDPPELIDAFYAKWQEGNDVVYGRRSAREGSRSFAQACRAFYAIFSCVSSVSIPRDAGDFSLIDRRVVNEMLAFPEADQFLRGLRAWVGFRQTGVDYLRPKRAFGHSNNNWRKNIWWAKKGIFSFSTAPVELLGYAGAVLTTISLFVAVYEVIDALRHPELSHGFAIIGVLIALFGSLNLFAISILGEYLIKIFDETKRRPKFIRKAVRHRGGRLDTAAEIDTFIRRRMSGTATAPLDAQRSTHDNAS